MDETEYWRAVAELRSKKGESMAALVAALLSTIMMVAAEKLGLPYWIAGFMFAPVFLFFWQKIGNWFEDVPYRDPSSTSPAD